MSKYYDEMINWDVRLRREIPLLKEVFKGKKRLLDIACSTGRHAISLSDDKEILGIDINENMINQAKKNAENGNSSAIFEVYNALDPIKSKFGIFDGGYILGNSISNLGSISNVRKFLENMREAIPNGKLFGQTVYLNNDINYLPLRSLKQKGSSIIIQRIMFPHKSKDANYLLHFNVIKDNMYDSHDLIPLFRVDINMLQKLANETGWALTASYGSYLKEEINVKSGSIQIWMLE